MKAGGTAIRQVYANLASGKRINSAADDPAGSAISQKLKAQESGLQQGAENAATAQNAVQTADTALSSIQDSLQRMRTLAVQASNSGVLTSSNQEIIQNEIDQIKESISDTVSNTQFNAQKLINGNFQSENVASNAQGKGRKVSISDSSLEALGIKNFNVTGDFSVKTIDQAINKVSQTRSNLGAASNRLDSTITSNRIAAYNQAQANSKIADADMAKQIAKLNSQEVLRQYKYFVQNQRMNQQGQILNLIG